MPRVAQYDDHGPHRLVSSRRWVRNHAQPTEVRLRHLTRRGVLHPHRGLSEPTPVAFQNETAQRRIRYYAPSNGQQLLDAGHLQPVAGEPLVDLIRPGLQQILPGRGHSPRPRLADASQPAQLLRIGPRTVPGDALRLCRRQSLPLRRQGYLRTVLRDRPVPDAISRGPTPACQRRMISCISILGTSRYAISAPQTRSAAMVADAAPQVGQRP